MEKKFKYYHPALERLRLILMFFMCIDLLGFPTEYGSLVQTFCGFTPIAFFILSGYLVLREDEDRPKRILRAIKRTAIVFGALLIGYFILNLLFYRQLGANIFPALASKRLWFNFIVLNIWPFDIGTAIWYVQSLLYAYIIIYFLDKWKLMKYDWRISAALIAFTVLTGELCGVIRWNLLGYNYIPGNFLTRALPYVLLGGFIHRKKDWFAILKPQVYLLAILAGILLMFLEVMGLGMLGVPGYYGHLIGMPVVAVAACMLAFLKDDYLGFEFTLGMSRWHINSIYYLCQPVSIGLVLALSVLGAGALSVVGGFIGIVTFLICFGIAWLLGFMSEKVSKK